MKVFDFTNGVKGQQIGETSLGALGGWWLDGKRVDGKSVQIDRYQYHEKAFKKFSGTEVKPEDFGVEAICFCQVFENNSGKVYNWSYVCTKEWLNKNVDWKYDDKANQDNKQGMINDLMEGIAFEEDYQIERALNRYKAMSYDQLKAEWVEFTK